MDAQRRGTRSTGTRDDEDEAVVLTVDELAARWRLDRKTVYSEIAEGRIPALRLGRVYRVPLAAVLSLEQGRVVPPGGAGAPKRG